MSERDEGWGRAGREKMELTRAREQCTGASTSSCVSKRGCMILKDAHPTCTRERSLTLIDNYVSIFIT